MRSYLVVRAMVMDLRGERVRAGSSGSYSRSGCFVDVGDVLHKSLVIVARGLV
jgi:hypothetical protein